ncbi:unnamed protein product [Effrenium voratum]|nr:unnamed protein product [Effrenium voratum]
MLGLLLWLAVGCLGEEDVINLKLIDSEGKLVSISWNPIKEDVAVVSKRYAQALYEEAPGCEVRQGDESCAAMEIEARLRLRKAEMAVEAKKNGTKFQAKHFLPFQGRKMRLPFQEEAAAIALYSGHDASIAVGINGRIQCVLELERLFGQRYYQPPSDPEQARKEWLQALEIVRDFCECEGGECPIRFKHGIIVDSGGNTGGQLRDLVMMHFTVEDWHFVDHQTAHASMGMYASPFRSALVVAYDADFMAFVASHGKLEPVARLDYNLGTTYIVLATFLPEVSGVDEELFGEMCEWGGDGPLFPAIKLDWAGKLMGYAATGKARPEVRETIRQLFESSGAMPKMSPENLLTHGEFKTELPRLFKERILGTACESLDGQRDLAASIQEEFENFSFDVITSLVDFVGSQNIDGVVLTGGCALNVLTNQKVHDSFTVPTDPTQKVDWQSGKKPLEVYVPPSPNDSGLTLGGIWAITPPPVQQSLQYLGFRLWDGENLAKAVHAWGARRLSELGGVDYLAELLAGGPAWLRDRKTSEDRPIIALVRGRQEFGPRALGHRSLLAVPDSNAMRLRMNRLKSRQWYRPVAPMIAEEALEEVFGRVVKSTAMTMAPAVKEDRTCEARPCSGEVARLVWCDATSAPTRYHGEKPPHAACWKEVFRLLVLACYACRDVM